MIVIFLSFDELELRRDGVSGRVNVEDSHEMYLPLQGHDGSKISSNSYDGTIRVWDANTGLEILQAPSESAPNVADEVSIMFPPDGQLISLQHGWFTNLTTGRCLVKLSVGVSHILCDLELDPN
jgi:WD40 repeat protein